MRKHYLVIVLIILVVCFYPPQQSTAGLTNKDVTVVNTLDSVVNVLSKTNIMLKISSDNLVEQQKIISLQNKIYEKTNTK